MAFLVTDGLEKPSPLSVDGQVLSCVTPKLGINDRKKIHVKNNILAIGDAETLHHGNYCMNIIKLILLILWYDTIVIFYPCNARALSMAALSPVSATILANSPSFSINCFGLPHSTKPPLSRTTILS